MYETRQQPERMELNLPQQKFSATPIQCYNVGNPDEQNYYNWELIRRVTRSIGWRTQQTRQN